MLGGALASKPNRWRRVCLCGSWSGRRPAAPSQPACRRRPPPARLILSLTRVASTAARGPRPPAEQRRAPARHGVPTASCGVPTAGRPGLGRGRLAAPRGGPGRGTVVRARCRAAASAGRRRARDRAGSAGAASAGCPPLRTRAPLETAPLSRAVSGALGLSICGERRPRPRRPVGGGGLPRTARRSKVRLALGVHSPTAVANASAARTSSGDQYRYGQRRPNVSK